MLCPSEPLVPRPHLFPDPPKHYFCRANASWRPPGCCFCRANASWSLPEHEFCRASASGRRSLSASGSGDNLANPSHGSRAMDPSTHALIQPCIHRPFIHASIHGCAQHRNSWALSPTCVLWGQTINVRPPFHKPRDATSEPLAHRLHSPATPAPSSDLSPLSPQRPQRNPRSGNNYSLSCIKPKSIYTEVRPEWRAKCQ